MEGLSLDNILGSEEIENLFLDDNQEDETPVEGDTNTEEKEKETENKETTEEVNVDTLFTDNPESVGSEDEDNKGKEGTNSEKDNTSPQNNSFYSSIATALKEDGIFLELDDETVNNIKSPEDFANAIEQQIQAKFDERQKRIDDALNSGIEPSEIKKYEDTIGYLNSIKEEDITKEDDNGEALRKRLIYADLINRGLSKERATREVEKSLKFGTDIEDAKEALASNKEYFNTQYNNMVKDAKEEEAKLTQERKAQAEKLKSSILSDSKVFGDIQVDKATRQKIFDNISKPVYKDPETGELYTAIQKYEMENKTDFLKNLGIVFTLTNGFKDIDGLVKSKVNKEMKKGIKNLENTINNSSRNPDGSLRFASGVGDDNDSYIGKGWTIDV